MLKPTAFDKLQDWVTPEEARKFLRLGETAMYERLRAGEIVSRKFGRVWRIPKTALRPDTTK